MCSSDLVPALGLVLGLAIFVACFIADVNWSLCSLGILAVLSMVFSLSEARHAKALTLKSSH